MKYYSGVGSRQTPIEVCNLFSYIGLELEKLEFILRSGGADGADLAFEKLVKNKEIYVPWIGFNGSCSTLVGTEEAFTMVSTIHPAWNKCSMGAKKLHARNCHQILGHDLKTPVEFVLCWTENGEIKGGTATAINLAKQWNIPVLNFGSYKYENMKDIFEKFMFRNHIG